MRYELAQLNIARMVAPLDSPAMKDFVDNVERINALAEASDGFVWRLQTEEGDATAAEHPFGDDMLVNVSVWRDPAALHAYVYESAHMDFVRRRKEWFQGMAEAYVVLWWVPEGHRPTPAEAAERLATLRREGPTAEAFTLRRSFDPPA